MSNENQNPVSAPILSNPPKYTRPPKPERPNLRVNRPQLSEHSEIRGTPAAFARPDNPMANVLGGAINRMDSAAQVRQSLALAYWERAVGAQAAAASEAESVRDGVLIVRTKSSVWSHELALHKSRILQNLNRMLGGAIIREIIFRATGVTAKVEAVPETDTPTQEDLQRVALNADEKAELREKLNALIHIPNDHIRQTIATRLTLDAKFRHWQLEHGFRICRRCDALHKTPYAVCPVCRLCR